LKIAGNKDDKYDKRKLGSVPIAENQFFFSLKRGCKYESGFPLSPRLAERGSRAVDVCLARTDPSAGGRFP
jgi:hypothetical protein